MDDGLQGGLRQVGLSEAAARRTLHLIEQEGRAGLRLRLMVDGGGCSGFSYRFDLDDMVNDDDRLFEAHGVAYVIDEASLDLLAGSEIDYVDNLAGASFLVKNPNASSTCGCGTSFAL